jgi:homoserine kinase
MTEAEIVVPGSTSNLGASFDACGLALSLYLRVTVAAESNSFEILGAGEGAETLPPDESNLIARVARFVAERRGKKIRGARLLVENQIPLARGLGSSSSAIIAGISVYEVLSGERLTQDDIFSYAMHFESHGDNLAPGLLGGLVVTCVVEKDDGQNRLVTVKRPWPEAVKIVLAIPDYEMDTAQMRLALPQQVPLSDAVFNLQRSALLQALLSEQRLDLFSEALRDRLHQPHRAQFGPGIREVLKLNDETNKHPGLLGVAVSGAGSTLIAFATEHLRDISATMGQRLKECGAESRIVEVEVDTGGRAVTYS